MAQHDESLKKRQLKQLKCLLELKFVYSQLFEMFSNNNLKKE